MVQRLSKVLRVFTVAPAILVGVSAAALAQPQDGPLGVANPAKVGLGDEIKQKDIGPGLAWTPQHDLVSDFLEVYASWPELGAPMSAAALLGFKAQLVERMLNTNQDQAKVAAEQKQLSDSFDSIAIPVITKMFVFEAMTQKPSELKAYATRSKQTLYVALGGKPEDLAEGGTLNPEIAGLVDLIKQAVLDNKDEIKAASSNGTTKAEAYAAFKEAIKQVNPTPPTTALPLAHSTLPVTIAGDYVLDPAKVEGLYGSDAFGTVTRGGPGATQVSVRDQHYPLARDASGKPTQVGVRMIPVSDPHVALGKGEQPDPKKPGSHLIDRFLRSAQGLAASDPIFALAVYLTPPGPRTSWPRRALDESSHVSVYLGQGLTRSSPETYHNNEWYVRNYPATVQVISMAGTDQATLNRNGLIAASILNPGVVFPGGSQPDYAITLGRTLAFYRGWLKGDPHTTNLATSSAEHVAIVTNVMLNVPHNAASFSALWGAEGVELLSLAKTKFQRATGTALVETTFEPLWRKDGIANPTNSTNSTNPDACRSVGERADKQGLAWAPEDAIDRLENGLEVHASWARLGAHGGAHALLRLAAAFAAQEQRGGKLPEQIEQALVRFVTAVIPQMFVHEAMTLRSRSELRDYALEANADRYLRLGGKPRDLAGGTPNAKLLAIVSATRRALVKNKAEIVRRAKAKTSVEQAYALFRSAIESDLRALRRAYRVPGRSRYEATSGITHRVATGLHPGHAKVKIEAVATVFAAEDLTTKAELKKREDAAAATANGGTGLGLTDAMKKANGGTNND